MKYDAMTIDTQTIERNGFRFDSGLLAQLKQFVHGPTEVVVSVVVATETPNHLSDRTRAAKDALETAHKNAVELGLKKPEEVLFSEAAPDARAVAKNRLERFLREIGACVLQVDDLAMRDLVQRYFSGTPPFAVSGKKKNEFPDAIALLSLEAWASKNQKRILAVSDDKDWMAFGRNSDALDVITDLSEALAIFQEHADEANEIVEKLLVEMQEGQRDKLKGEFIRHLEDAVSDYSYSMYAEVDSAYETEGGEIELTMLGFVLPRDEEAYLFKVVRFGSKEIVAQIDLELAVRAEASFVLSLYDSIDKDYMVMGSTDATTEETFEAAALVTFQGDFALGDVSIKNIELVGGPSSIDFGYLEPDHSDDYHDDGEHPHLLLDDL